MALQGSAANLIAGFEGFRSEPYYDVNAYRTGFGSDTTTTAEGQIIPIRQGMTVSREDAERDLNRRVGDFQTGIVGSIGQDAWGAMNEDQRSALTSIAYNYGSLPDRVTRVIAAGGDIAGAISSLRGDNEGINASRRDQEAQLFAGDTRVAQADTGTQTDATQETPEERMHRFFREGRLSPENREKYIARFGEPTAQPVDQPTELPKTIIDAYNAGQLNPANTQLVSDFLASQQAQPEAPEEDRGFLGRVTERLRTRGEEFRELEPPETVIESLGRGVQAIGMGAGGVLDVGGETVATGFDLLSKAASAVTPDFIEDPIVKGVGNAFEGIVGTDIAQKGIEAAGKGIDAYQEFSTEHPEATATLESLVNIALVATPVRGKPRAPGGPTAVGRAGQRVEAAAVTQEQAARASFVDDLIRPRTSKAVREQEILRTAEGGLVTGRTVTPSAAEQAIATTVTDVAGVTPKNTLLQNLTAIQAEIGTEAKSLASILEASTVKIGRPSIKTSMDDVLVRLADNPILVGDAARTGERTVARAKAFLEANPNTPAGVFKARQEFDAWVRTQRPKVFDPNTESALSIAVRETRQAMNDIVATNAPETGVKASLSRQSNLFSAVENIGPKAANEASTIIGRLGQRVQDAVGLKPFITQNIPQIATAGAIAGGGVLAPSAVATGIAIIGLGVGGTKLVMSPTTKRAVAGLLVQTDKAMIAAKGNAELLRQLRLDRAAVVEIMKDSEIGE